VAQAKRAEGKGSNLKKKTPKKAGARCVPAAGLLLSAGNTKSTVVKIPHRWGSKGMSRKLKTTKKGQRNSTLRGTGGKKTNNGETCKWNISPN